MNKLYMIKLAKNAPDIAVGVLEIYKVFLSAKLFATDSLLKGVKFYHSRQISLASSKNENSEDTCQEINTVKENKSMKKSTIFALLAFIAAAVGAMIAVAAYLKKKEENLREYEEMLFNEDYLADYMPKDDECCFEEDCCEEEFFVEELCADECCCEEKPEQE